MLAIERAEWDLHKGGTGGVGWLENKGLDINDTMFRSEGLAKAQGR